MKNGENVFAFDLGWAFHGWAIKNIDKEFDAGVYAFNHDTAREEYVKIKREKNRKKSRNRRREQLKQDVVATGLFKSKKDFEKFLKQNSHQNRMWEILKLAHHQLIDPKDFAAILYRFAKKRHYVDMCKKIALEKSDSEQSKKKKKEEGAIKNANSMIEEIYHALPDGSTWFDALFKRREELISLYRSKNVQFDAEKFPYTNRRWKKFKDTYKKSFDKKEITGYELLLKNEQVAQSLEQVAQKQRALGNTHPIYSKSFMENYVKLITFKGVQPSFEDKIGLCLSGEDLKRHPISSIDAEKTRIAQLLHSIIVEVDSDGQVIREFKLIDTGLDFDTFIFILMEMITQKGANKKAEITANKLITKLKSKGYLPKKNKFIFKQFKHKEKPGSAIVLRMPGHLRFLNLSQPLQEALQSNDDLRDSIEFTMLVYKDPDTLRGKLIDIFHTYDTVVSENDVDTLSLSDTGKPAPCHNKTYRKILPQMIEGKDFQTALSESFPNALTNQKRYYRKYLNFKLYQAEQQRKGINNPYQDTIIKEFIFLFNRLVQKYGEPDRIVFETTREILSTKEKEEIEKRIQKNTELNQQITQVLEEHEKDGEKAPKGARERLKLFVQQGGKLFPDKEGKRASARCILTNNPICLKAALDGNRTNTDHIIPQTWIHDNRLDNKILLDKKVNQSQKRDMTPIQYLKSLGHTEESAIRVLKKNIGIYTKEEREKAKDAKDKLPQKMSLSQIKIRHIFENRTKDVIKKDAEDRIHSMDQRMSGEQNHAVKAIMSLLVDQLRFNTDKKLTIQEYRSKVLPINGSMTNLFRRGWLSQYKKDRSQYHNHAIDALIMLNFDRSMLQRYVTLLKESYLKDKNPIWIPKEELFPTIENFESIAMRFKDEYEEQKRVVVRREQRKYRGRVYEQTAYKKGKEKSALYVKGYFRKAGSGFLKLLVFKNQKNKFKAVKIHPAMPKYQDIEKYIVALYRHSLIRIMHKQYCGYYYLIGYDSSNRKIELEPANYSLEKKIGEKEKPRIRPTLSSLLELEYIGEAAITGIVKFANC